MLAAIAPYWMANAWTAPVTDTDTMRDINGVLITVGATVALLGTVTALNPNAQHFDDVTISTLHPDDINVMNPRVITAHPLELVVQ